MDMIDSAITASQGKIEEWRQQIDGVNASLLDAYSPTLFASANVLNGHLAAINHAKPGEVFPAEGLLQKNVA